MTESDPPILLETGFYRLVEGRHGRFLINPRDTVIGRSLAVYGEYSEEECVVLCQILAPGGVAIEVGTNIGALTVPLAHHLGPDGLLYAMEPQPLIFQQLAANLALNDLVNVAAMNMAIGRESAWIGMARLDPEIEINSGGVPLDQISSQGEMVRVQIARLDDVIDPPRLDLIKIDVEGMELDVLEGGAALIQRFRPVLYLECNQSASEILIPKLAELGYKAWWHVPPLFNPENHAGRAEDVFPNTYSFNLLCFPEENAPKVEGLEPVAGPSDHPIRWSGGGAARDALEGGEAHHPLP
ncbi:MAG: FkbM family methyltransferase [Pseudomonadota bacterium]